MSIFQPIVLGLVQGLTEFLPISSSGHLILIPKLFGWAEQGLAFDATIHLATLAAVIVALWGDVKNLGLGIFKKNESGKLAWRIIAASIPVLFLGWFLNDWIENYFRSPVVVVVSLVFWGLILWLTDTRVKKNAENCIEKVGLRQTFLISLSQVIAFIPGTSRSGITISAGLFSGLSREAAARFSFLLSVPAIAAAGVYSFWKILGSGEASDWSALVIAFVAAFISGFLAIRFLLKIMKVSSYKWFVFYRLALAAIILISVF